MSNIMDIARSAIGAYRTALGVTGENIANVNTDGYRRRDVQMEQMGGAQTSPLSLATGGQGVKVADIRRAFDVLLSDRLRLSSGDVQSATAHLEASKALEALMLPGTGGIDSALEEFFSALGKLASSPADTALRRVVMEAGGTLAAAFADIGAGMARLQAQVVQDAGMTADLLNGDLKALADLQYRFAGNSGTVGALNPLADERDRLLGAIAQKVGISVAYDRFGRAQVSLGTQGGGPLLVGFEGDVASVSVTGDDLLALTVTRAGTAQESRLYTSGQLAGLSAAFAATRDAMLELDALAGKMAAEANAVHRVGVDLTGQSGTDLFSLDGWRVQPGITNQGSMTVRITPTGPATGPVTLVRDAAAGGWRAEDAAGTVIGTGDRLLVLPGLTVALDGTAAEGDRLTLSPVTGHAVDMRFVPTEPGQIAAAQAMLTAPMAGNRGSATVQMGPTLVPPPALPLLSDVLAGATSAATAATLLSSGVVGYVPAGTGTLSLASLGLQAGAEFSLPPSAVAGLGTLSLTLDGVAHSIGLTPRPSGWGLAEVAAALNDGTFATATGQTLAGVGIAATARDGVLSLARATGGFDAASLDGTAAVLSPAAPAGGTIQIFTREGRQIAGTRMAAADVAALMTQANGFLPGATYRPDWLNGAAGTAYRGLALDAVQGTGLQAVTLLSDPPALWSGAVQAPANPPRSIAIETGSALPTAITLPEGGTARRLAALAMAAVPGLSADADTAVEIAAPSDGRLTFLLEGDNAAPLIVSADVAGGRMDALLMAVNGLTGATGIAAELSPDGGRLLLRHDGGADIRLTGLTHSAGAPVTLRPADAAGAPLGAAVTLGAGQDGARFSGTVTLRQTEGFSAVQGGQRIDSAADALHGGLVTRTTSGAGAVQALTFRLDAPLDATGTDPASASVAAGGARYQVTLGGRSVALSSVQAGAQDGAGIAAGLAALLRDGLPQAALTGAALAQLPAEGASTVVQVDGQDYVLRMQGGTVAVTGPEAGRLSAAFGPDNRLRLAVNGGVTDAATIALPAGLNGAAAFGLSPAQGARATLLGQVPTALPATLSVMVGGTRHDIAVSGGPSVTLPAGFPGTASLQDGAILLDIPAAAGPLRVLAGTGSGAAGFATLGAALTVTGATLTARASDGAALDLRGATAALAAQRLHLTGLPPEDLIVVMTGSGTLRMAGSVTAGVPAAAPPDVTLRVTDAAAGTVELFDTRSGHSIGTRSLDASGGATLGGLAVSLTGRAVTGDRFTLTANTDGGADGRAIDALLSLRFLDKATGKGGFAQVLAGFQSDIGTRTAAAARRVTATEAILDTTRRADAAQGAVDLDTEAARLLEMQQAYQANAQVMTVAKDLFDTLLRSL